ncbi:MAG: SDR family NAD(P)-dependent oxidoreductase [bacterium]|nr:SDR family NAD(P)-dependent oxidoreductase [Clostridium sp.]MCM1538384.1 SDR family NAD(P)-dependent oxidoreductase [bacterium]
MKQTVLITGASRGIGRACAELFAKEGYDLFLNCLKSEKELTDLAAELTAAYGARCRLFFGDVGDPHFVDRMFAQIDRLDVLVNNAGISHVGLLHEMTPEEWLHVMNVNLNSCFYTARHAVPLMLKEHSGRIIHISSVWGCVGASMETAYSASKAGVNGLTKALAKELAPSHISVNAVACGIIDTDMNRHLSAEELSSIKEEIPADRLGTAAEIAQTVLQLANAPDYLTGQIITVDGGWI